MLQSVFKMLFFLIMLSFLFTGTTDADMIVNKEIQQNEWSATTLEFSGRDTVTGTNTNLLFNIAGILPGGFQIKAIRMKKDGRMDFDYVVSAEITGGDQTFCTSLNITILDNWQKKYSGKLENLLAEKKMEESGQNDWVFVISLDSKDVTIKNKSCNFNILFKTKGSGFNDEKKMENQASSGSW